MNAIGIYVLAAHRILARVWADTRDQASLTGIRWLYSEEGSLAFFAFATRSETAPPELRGLVWDIFLLQCEIAARKAGWCPELEPQPVHAENA